MIKRRKIKRWAKVFLIILLGVFAFPYLKKTYSRYYSSLRNNRDLSLAPWVISINGEPITSGEMNIGIEPVVTEITVYTNTYSNKIVPGSKGYFDVVIDPTGTGVSVDYIIDFQPDNLPGGMVYTKYEKLDENGSIIGSYSIPSNAKITGTLSMINRNLLGSESILRYRVYWDYIDDDSLNTTIGNLDKEGNVMINVTLKQVI